MRNNITLQGVEMTVALIPARGGSKRIPRKNIKNFCGKPIIAYSIEAASASKCFDRIVVSTDDEEIASIATHYGAEVPFIRPSELADDFASTIDVVNHGIQALALPTESWLCCLYATAPFVKPEDLISARSMFMEQSLDYVFSATEYLFPIQRAFRLNHEGMCEMFTPEYFSARSQDLEPAYHDAGQFYFGKVSAFLRGAAIFHQSVSKPLLLPSYRVQDIDTPDDWVRAEQLALSITNSA